MKAHFPALLALVSLLVSGGPAAAAAPAIAVFDIQDTGTKLPKKTLDQLSNYLATRVAEAGVFTVVPRTQIKSALAAQKSESYKSCYDESCQIEVGREVAAAKSLLTQLGKIGTQCVLTCTLYDLRMGASERAATARAACNADALIEAIDRVAEEIKGKGGSPGGSVGPPPTSGGKRVRRAVNVSSTPSGATLFVGLTEVGKTPVKVELFEGEYAVSVVKLGFSTETREVKVAAGGDAIDLDFLLKTGGAASPPSSKPEPKVSYPSWVEKGSGVFEQGGKKVFVGVGAASEIFNPIALTEAAALRATAEIAKAFSVYTKDLLKQYQEGATGGGAAEEEQKVGPVEKTFTSHTLTGVRLAETWVHPVDGTLYALAALDLEKAAAPGVSEHAGRGAPDVLVLGPAGPEVDRSARLAAFASATLRLAAERRGIKIGDLIKSYESTTAGTAESEQSVTQMTKGEVSTAIERGKAKVTIDAILKSYMESRTSGDFSSLEEDQQVDSVVKIEAQSSAGKAVITLDDGVLVTDPKQPTERALAVLEGALSELGIKLLSVKELARVHKTPVFEVRLSAPRDLPKAP